MINQTNLPGYYSLEGVMETASGFHLQPDNRFEFYFSYGALDRLGRGSYQVSDSQIIFNSDPPFHPPFSLIKTGKQEQAAVLVQVADKQAVLLPHIKVTIYDGDKMQTKITDDRGASLFDEQPVTLIELQFEFCPEKIARFEIKEPTANYFLLKFDNSLFDYYFEQFALEIDDRQLRGSHPMLREGNYIYRRASEPE